MSDQTATLETNAAPQTTAAQDWWRDLDTRDRAGRARLKRADLDAAMIDEATMRLFRRLGRRTPRDLSRIAALATVLAAVRQDTGRAEPFARQIGFSKLPADPQKPDADNKPALSVLRFKRLMSASDDADLARQLRRAVDLLGGKANVEDIKRVVLGWHRPETRRSFAFDYFGAGIAAPSHDTATDADVADNSLDPALSA
ncbi:MAG: type I-E CRISPR-associated protein Cse2/CasB [Rhodopseudomonas palustris]|nr:MAG: type I-E CRISPR-associated protein Cse2/CasB [Rhodopseudomonas palustris]